MSLTYAQYKTAIWDALGVTDDDGYLPSSAMDSLFNAATRLVASTADWPWLASSTTMTATIGSDTLGTVPADAMLIHSVTDQTDGSSPLSFVYPSTFLENKTLNQSGTPEDYTIIGSTLRVDPTPTEADTFDVLYRGSETVASTDADTFKIPDFLSQLYIYKTAELAAARNKDSEMRNLMRRMFTDAIDEASAMIVQTAQAVVPPVSRWVR